MHGAGINPGGGGGGGIQNGHAQKAGWLHADVLACAVKGHSCTMNTYKEADTADKSG